MSHVMILKGRLLLIFEEILTLEEATQMIRLENGLEVKKIIYFSHWEMWESYPEI